jgi:putative flippase GtrA
MRKSYRQRITKNPLYIRHQEKVKFGLVGGINTVLDLIIYGFLVKALGIFVVAANIISTSIVLLVSFALNDSFVWKSKKSRRETAPRFVMMSLFSAWVVQSGIIWIVVNVFGGSDTMNLVAKLMGIGAGMVSNYFGYKYIFR